MLHRLRHLPLASCQPQRQVQRVPRRARTMSKMRRHNCVVLFCVFRRILLLVFGQRNGIFWESIAHYYNEYKSAGSGQRSTRSLESRWGCIKSGIKHDVSKFNGIYKQIKDLDINGTSEEDLQIWALDLYRQKHQEKKKFAYLDCWFILKECLRWADVREEVRQSSVPSSIS